eukprot:CAMPEP_0198724906 /NCGR_PEP_ID=MMETSP1475-20131203/2305_1 /TAXON_ID= ORGANISM="Unidentified sp., Strain CCMP1999" /NCGR_SAMPLE_ID=MMETSP1475 /ASSEMBLY_ACC=CAM_ASM_001111 /LENGTH=233 /DNA_ID=CAMNT_0044486545 /DNA_START=34 /DNA_END=732 /DNA_ORIENTATION=-
MEDDTAEGVLRRRLHILGYPHWQNFGLRAFPSLLLWLEDTVVRLRDPDERLDLVTSEAALQEYLLDLKCPEELCKPARRDELVGWLTDFASHLVFQDVTSGALPAAGGGPSRTTGSTSGDDMELDKTLKEVCSLIGLPDPSQLPSSQTEEVAAAVVRAITSRKRVNEAGKSAQFVDVSSVPVVADDDRCPASVLKALQVLRSLHFYELREVQYSVNSVLDHLQRTTANLERVD